MIRDFANCGEVLRCLAEADVPKTKARCKLMHRQQALAADSPVRGFFGKLRRLAPEAQR